MPRKIVVKNKLFILFLLLPCLVFSQGVSSFSNVKVIKVYDGDTFKVNLPCNIDVLCKKISIRVKDIDTPELKTKDKCEKKQAIKAKGFTADFLKQGQVDLLKCKRDKYFRLLCDVYVDGENLATELLKNKLAYSYNGGKKIKRDYCKNENQNR